MEWFFKLSIDVTVWDLIPFFLHENSSCCEKAFLYGFSTYHLLSDYILVIINLLDVPNSVCVIEALGWSNSQHDLYYWCNLEEVELHVLLTRLS